jgi:hypothetical protein
VHTVGAKRADIPASSSLPSSAHIVHHSTSSYGVGVIGGDSSKIFRAFQGWRKTHQQHQQQQPQQHHIGSENSFDGTEGSLMGRIGAGTSSSPATPEFVQNADRGSSATLLSASRGAIFNGRSHITIEGSSENSNTATTDGSRLSLSRYGLDSLLATGEIRSRSASEQPPKLERQFSFERHASATQIIHTVQHESKIETDNFRMSACHVSSGTRSMGFLSVPEKVVGSFLFLWFFIPGIEILRNAINENVIKFHHAHCL